MTKRGRKYKRNPNLKRDYIKHIQAQNNWITRLTAWEKVLKNNLSELAINNIANLLARLGFEPDEQGIPQGNWPPISKMSPLALLDAYSLSIRHISDKSTSGRFNTLAWKADILKAATLLWAGAIQQNQISQVAPLASDIDVWFLLDYSDIETFWKGPGKGKTADNIRIEWERGEFDIDARKLADMLKNAKGGT